MKKKIGTFYAECSATNHLDRTRTIGVKNILGARTLEGLNIAVDPARKRLIAAGSPPAAALV